MKITINKRKKVPIEAYTFSFQICFTKKRSFIFGFCKPITLEQFNKNCEKAKDKNIQKME